jgi:hypothetical protein
MKSNLNALLLLSALALAPTPATARPSAPAVGNCVLSGAPTATCVENLSLSPGSVYSVQLTSTFLVNLSHRYWVTFNSPNCPKNSYSASDYFPVTLTYNNVTYSYLPTQWFTPTASPQTLTLNFDLTNATFPNCSTFPSCSQIIEVRVDFHDGST